MILKNLGQRKDCFNCETSVAEEGNVGRGARDEWEKDVDRQEGRSHVGEELVVPGYACQLFTRQPGQVQLTGEHSSTSRSRMAADPIVESVTSRL